MFLETERLVLRAFTGADLDELVALHSDPEVMRFLDDGQPVGRADVEARILPTVLREHPVLGIRCYWAAERKDTGAFLGWLEFRPVEDAVAELGYRLNRSSWGSGYATEGARALIDNGFRELGVRRVTANTMAVNTRSRRVLEKSGLVFVRTFTEDWPVPLPGSEHGEVEYELTRARWAVSASGR